MRPARHRPIPDRRSRPGPYHKAPGCCASRRTPPGVEGQPHQDGSGPRVAGRGENVDHDVKKVIAEGHMRVVEPLAARRPAQARRKEIVEYPSPRTDAARGVPLDGETEPATIARRGAALHVLEQPEHHVA